jgi:hypothetical protein
MKMCGGDHGGNHEEVIVYVPEPIFSDHDAVVIGHTPCPLCAKTEDCTTLLLSDAKRAEEIEKLEGQVASLEFELEGQV